MKFLGKYMQIKKRDIGIAWKKANLLSVLVAIFYSVYSVLCVACMYVCIL